MNFLSKGTRLKKKYKIINQQLSDEILQKMENKK